MKRRLLVSFLVAAVTAVLAVGSASAAVKPHDVTAGSTSWGAASWGSSSWDAVRPHDVTAGVVVWRVHPRDVTAGSTAWSAVWGSKVRPNASSWS